MAFWQAQTVQMVWFTPHAATVSLPPIYEAALGEQPDLIQNNKSPTAQNPHLQVTIGQAAGAQFQLTSQPGRIDLVASPLEVEGEAPPLTIEHTERVYEKLRSIAETSRKLIPGTNRVALVSNLLEPSSSLIDANRLVASALVGLDIQEQDTDIVFQLNRRKSLEMDGLVLNRMLRIGMATFQQFQIEMTPNGPTSAPSVQLMYAPNLMIDVNSVPVPRELKDQELVHLWQAIFDEASRLRADGTLAGLKN